MKLKIFPLAIVLFTIFLFILTSCSYGDKNTIEEKLQKVLDDGISKYDVRGVSAAVIFPDQKVWKGVSGISHDTVSIKSDMLFAIGSITKNVVAALTLKLAEEGMLSLEDPLSKWLPRYPYVDSTITIGQLLNHTSGIYMFWDNQEIWDDLKKDRTKVWTPEEVLSYIKEPHYAPGQGWRYSNTNYLLLAMIVTKATGSNLSTEFNKYFWNPLNINNAYLSIEEDIPSNQAHVYGDNFNNDGSNLDLTFLPRASHESITYGSAGLFMTAEDLAHWCNALFEGEVLHRESINEMLKFVDIGFGPRKRGYGLGVELYMRRISSGERAIGHSGANIGTSVYMVHLPEHHFTVVVMINDFNHKCSQAITKDLIANVLKEFNVIGIIPYFDFFPLGFVIIGATMTLLVIIFFKLRRLKANKKCGKVHS
ncbi:MAG: serine hydrolase domain-containing protein [Atribacterota bacterium]